MIIYLIGYMGSGKSTAGRKLASALSLKFVDLDNEIESREGREIKDIFATEGETYFRNIESEVLHSCSESENTVISCGGGTPCFNSNMEYMLGRGLTVYLKMKPEQLKSRLTNTGTVRPLIKNIPPEKLVDFIREALLTREKWYSMSEIVVDGHDIDIPELTETIRKKLKQ